jgi:hypothetical protein
MSFELVCALGFLFIFLITPFDGPLWSIQNRAFIFSIFPNLPPGTVVCVLLANGLLNAALLRPVYKLKMPIDSRFRSGLLPLTHLLNAVPVFGLFTILIWRWILQTRPSWAFRPGAHEPSLHLTESVPAERPLDGNLYFKRLLLELIAINTACFAALNQWISELGSTTGGKACLLAASVLLHSIAFSAVHAYLQSSTSPTSESAKKNLLAALFWLLPVPYLPVIGFLVLSWVTREARRAQTLINESFSRQGRAERLPQWRQVLASPANHRPRKQPATASRARSRLRALQDMKAFAPSLSVAPLSWFLNHSTRFSPLLAFVARALLGMIVLVALIFGIISLGFFACLGARRWIRRFPTRSWVNKDLARALALLALALYLGVLQGTLWSGVVASDLKQPLVWVVCAYLSFKGLSLLRFVLPYGVKPEEEPADHCARFFFTLALWCTLPLLSATARACRADLMLKFWLLSALLCDVLPGAVRLPWLLRPYTLRDLVSAPLPLRRKASLAFLVFTSVVPCGGLAVPIWSLLRPQLQAEEESLGQSVNR